MPLHHRHICFLCVYCVSTDGRSVADPYRRLQKAGFGGPATGGSSLGDGSGQHEAGEIRPVPPPPIPRKPGTRERQRVRLHHGLRGPRVSGVTWVIFGVYQPWESSFCRIIFLRMETSCTPKRSPYVEGISMSFPARKCLALPKLICSIALCMTSPFNDRRILVASSEVAYARRSF